MKNFLKSAIAAFSTFSRVPMPQIEWSEGSMRYIMAAFPLVGAAIGGLMFAFLRLADYLELPYALRALGMTLLPLAVTGGIHLDGLCDTCDALGAVTSPARRREILKDPRAGAFGVIGVAVYLLSYMALSYAALSCSFGGDFRGGLLYCLGFVRSRTLSAGAVLRLPPAPDGTGRAFRDAAERKGSSALLTFFLAAALAAAAIPSFASAPCRGAALFLPWQLASLLCLASLKSAARRKFEGMSGDLAGWFLQRCELWQLAALAIGGALARRFG